MPRLRSASGGDPGPAARLLIAPEGLSRFYHEDHESIGASWMTREERLEEIKDYLMYLDLVHDRVFAIVEREPVKLTV